MLSARTLRDGEATVRDVAMAAAGPAPLQLAALLNLERCGTADNLLLLDIDQAQALATGSTTDAPGTEALGPVLVSRGDPRRVAVATVMSNGTAARLPGQVQADTDTVDCAGFARLGEAIASLRKEIASRGEYALDHDKLVDRIDGIAAQVTALSGLASQSGRFKTELAALQAGLDLLRAEFEKSLLVLADLIVAEAEWLRGEIAAFIQTRTSNIAMLASALRLVVEQTRLEALEAVVGGKSVTGQLDAAIAKAAVLLDAVDRDLHRAAAYAPTAQVAAVQSNSSNGW